ncbi:uncharacterized protein BX664DRAFT_329430 [Halteromyces radiatus]|uniref:uncharacterized protein n=1 Tax=Halteromyces radiatus TaxID=101107 RepID=UPI0022204E6A|nr:uncharacterized protein BX664DRAFT_329430 [Halteromyces radiatus]KAI8093318.1 hypothetical protein BX664DRAFT_329430 [Halteromyces radiatus]
MDLVILMVYLNNNNNILIIIIMISTLIIHQLVQLIYLNLWLGCILWKTVLCSGSKNICVFGLKYFLYLLLYIGVPFFFSLL